MEDKDLVDIEIPVEIPTDHRVVVSETEETTAPLSGDGWAKFKPMNRVTNKERRQAVLAQSTAEGGPLDRDFACFDVLLQAMITEWSLSLPLPSVDVKTINALSIYDSNILYEALRPVIGLLFPDFSPSPAPLVHTVNSNGSRGR